tara:strand:+ start:899 stop:2191 length:1293 start_codon:yes stop_codon:yes gene_type:complete
MDKQWIMKYGNTLESIKGRDKDIKVTLNLLETFKTTNKHIIIYANSGYGKSVISSGCLTKLDYDFVVVGSDIQKTKKYIDDLFDRVSNSMKIINGQFIKNPKKAIVFEDLESLSTIDNYFISSVIENINKFKNIVLIFTCDINGATKISKLESISNIVTLAPIPGSKIVELAKEIIIKENIRISKDVLINIIKDSNNDIRFFINNLQFISLNLSVSKSLTKDPNYSLWNCLNCIFAKNISIDECIRLTELEQRWIPNAIYENYVNHCDTIERISECMDDMCLSDVFEAFNTDNMHFDNDICDISNIYGVYKPTFTIKKYNKKPSKCITNIFPTYFGRTSNHKLNQNIVTYITNRSHITRDHTYMDFFKTILIKRIQDDIEDGIKLANSYELTKELYNYIIRPSIFNLTDCRKSIKPKVKKYLESKLTEPV